MKKPSGSSPGVLKALKKKPASKLSTAEHARQMKLGLNDSQDESDEEKDTDPDVARDKGKGVKWAKMRASDKLPAYIVDMYDKGGSHPLVAEEVPLKDCQQAVQKAG